MTSPSALALRRFHSDESYTAVRELQNWHVAQRNEILLIGEHAPVVTIGPRAVASDLHGLELLKRRGYEVHLVERGGGATLHLSGQLILYPVIDLRARRLGVREFIEQVFASIVRVCLTNGVPVLTSFSPVGVFCSGTTQTEVGKKVASAGLRIVEGVVNHGFALNICCDIEQFAAINACGLGPNTITSLTLESGRPIDFDTVFVQISQLLQERFAPL